MNVELATTLDASRRGTPAPFRPGGEAPAVRTHL
jgi:hypothetical protein